MKFSWPRKTIKTVKLPTTRDHLIHVFQILNINEKFRNAMLKECAADCDTIGSVLRLTNDKFVHSTIRENTRLTVAEDDICSIQKFRKWFHAYEKIHGQYTSDLIKNFSQPIWVEWLEDGHNEAQQNVQRPRLSFGNSTTLIFDDRQSSAHIQIEKRFLGSKNINNDKLHFGHGSKYTPNVFETISTSLRGRKVDAFEMLTSQRSLDMPLYYH
mmetsp:Transcript_50230/g.58634  ORF Transcript_50230/g.58634 Transcript_50230/m.58634 type:complete len:213 (-) Transcript_50230:95-733(-)